MSILNLSDLKIYSLPSFKFLSRLLKKYPLGNETWKHNFGDTVLLSYSAGLHCHTYNMATIAAHCKNICWSDHSTMVLEWNSMKHLGTKWALESCSIYSIQISLCTLCAICGEGNIVLHMVLSWSKEGNIYFSFGK